MSDPQAPPPSNDQPPGRDPRKERSPSGNGLWYLLVFGVIGLLVFSTLGTSTMGDSMALTEFERQVAKGELHSGNVFELTIGPTRMTWQDKSPEDVQKGATATRQYVAVWGIGDVSIDRLLTLLKLAAVMQPHNHRCHRRNPS
ncbi:MAG: hypothetical protein GY826_39815 [Fuerstiella sp.]|nr:hypothetical protein [Fuerstiella sp.]